MVDAVLVLVVVAFFVLAWLYVRGCELLVGSGRTEPVEEAGAAPDISGRTGAIVTADDVIGLVLAVALVGYLLFALLFPERL